MYVNRILGPLLVTVVYVFCTQPHVFAGCGWFCGGEWEVLGGIPSTVRDVLDTSTGANKGCDSPGEEPPSTTCVTEAGEIEVIEWDVSGELTAGICGDVGINVGASVGKSTTYSYSAHSGSTITSFCQTCKAVVGLEYTTTYYIIHCTCGTVIGGTVKKFNGKFTNATNGMQSNPPCNPNCPSGG